MTPVVNITNILQAACVPKNYKHKLTAHKCSAKKLLYVKSACNWLVKMSPVVSQYHQHFTSSLCANFLNLRKTLLYAKAACKMLEKDYIQF